MVLQARSCNPPLTSSTQLSSSQSCFRPQGKPSNPVMRLLLLLAVSALAAPQSGQQDDTGNFVNQIVQSLGLMVNRLSGYNSNQPSTNGQTDWAPHAWATSDGNQVKSRRLDITSLLHFRLKYAHVVLYLGLTRQQSRLLDYDCSAYLRNFHSSTSADQYGSINSRCPRWEETRRRAWNTRKRRWTSAPKASGSRDSSSSPPNSRHPRPLSPSSVSDLLSLLAVSRRDRRSRIEEICELSRSWRLSFLRCRHSVRPLSPCGSSSRLDFSVSGYLILMAGILASIPKCKVK